MALRTPPEMKMHYTLIKSLEGLYLNQKGASSVRTNLDREDAVVLGLMPDLIIKSSFTLYFKVETQSTVTEGSAIEWKSFSEKLGQFYLLVPAVLKPDAEDIIKRLAIPKVVLLTYKIKENKLSFSGLP